MHLGGTIHVWSHIYMGGQCIWNAHSDISHTGLTLLHEKYILADNNLPVTMAIKYITKCSETGGRF